MNNFDTSKYRLGSLCKRNHDWCGTGQSLRRIGNQVCTECAIVHAKNYRPKKPQRPGLHSLSTEERFYLYVDKREVERCWNWLGWKDKDGYGKFRVDSSHSVPAHRFAWEVANNQSVPHGLVVRHLCNNPSCCNSRHLAIGTQADNRQDCISAKRHAYGETHPKSKLNELQVSRIKGLANKRVPTRELAKHFNVSKHCINSILSGYNWKNVEPMEIEPSELSQFDNSLMPKGDSCSNSKLTEAQVLQIKQMLKTTMSQREIGEKFGVRRGTICSIKIGKTWKHVK